MKQFEQTIQSFMTDNAMTMHEGQRSSWVHICAR